MNPSEPWPKRVSVEHVYLSYAYLNARDYDAFASLLDEDVTLRESDGTAAFGRAAVTAAEECRRFTYVIEDLWGSAEKMVVTGIHAASRRPLYGGGFRGHLQPFEMWPDFLLPHVRRTGIR